MTFHHKHASRQSRTRHGSRGLATGLLLVLGWCALSTEVGALQVLELLEPYSFVVDTDSKAYFISSVNGDETARDNNGFITKMDEAGTVVQLKFIAGGQNGHTLHAPKGLAIVGRTLYVVDLDQLKGYDKTTGQLLVTVPLGSGAAPQAGPPSQLMDVVTDGHGLLFVSDRTRDTIYRIAIAKNHQVSILIHNPGLAGPAGIALHPRGDRLVVVSWDKGKIVEVGFDGALTELVSNGFFSSRFGNLSGVDFDQWGNMYVSDFTRGKIWRMQPDQKFQVIAEYLPSPADIAIDRSNHVILVPYHYGNAAEVNGLESPIKKGGTKRTLSDYGFAPRHPGRTPAQNE